MLSEKYMAGFIDADGCLGVRCRIGARPDLIFEIAQHEKFAFVTLKPMMDEFGGQVRTVLEKYKSLSMRCGPARKLFERLAKYMVIKHDIALQYMDFVDHAEVIDNKQQLDLYRNIVKEIRKKGRTSPVPNYPSRKWLAGYFDGDGSFSASVKGDRSYSYPVAEILSAPHYSSGIELIQKAFGGVIYTGKDGSKTWKLALTDPSKCIFFLDFFAKHLVEKKAQAYFLLGCAHGGNFRDGKNIREKMLTLHAQQHRLSNPEQVAADYVKEINFNIPKQKVGRPAKRQSNS
jgi:hypothetical protein